MLSIIIPAYNEEKYLPVLLDSIKKQDYRDYEIIVADANSIDDTKKIAEKYGCRLVKGGTPAVGRNNGAKAAKGDIFLFLDADVKLPKNFLMDAMSEVDDKLIDLATFKMKPMSNLELDRIIHEAANLMLKFSSHLKDPHAPGFCILISKRLFKRINGFNESLRLAEDHDLVKRAGKFRKMEFFEKPYFYVNVRRLRKEGRLNYAGKVVYSEIYRILKGEIKKDIMEYEFGEFSKKGGSKKLREFESNLFKLERKIKKELKKLKKA